MYVFLVTSMLAFGVPVNHVTLVSLVDRTGPELKQVPVRVTALFCLQKNVALLFYNRAVKSRNESVVQASAQKLVDNKKCFVGSVMFKPDVANYCMKHEAAWCAKIEVRMEDVLHFAVILPTTR